VITTEAVPLKKVLHERVAQYEISAAMQWASQLNQLKQNFFLHFVDEVRDALQLSPLFLRLQDAVVASSAAHVTGVEETTGRADQWTFA